jgi:hypothetical protein
VINKPQALPVGTVLNGGAHGLIPATNCRYEVQYEYEKSVVYDHPEDAAGHVGTNVLANVFTPRSTAIYRRNAFDF